MKIYHLLSNLTHLAPISGDRLNEINFLKTISHFADVYYNNQRFYPDQPDFGLKDLPIEVPPPGYDLYIVRNNHDLFEQVPRPKVWVAYPYCETAFRDADAVIAFNETWAKGIREFNEKPDYYDFFCGAFPRDMVKPKRCISIGQGLDENFSPKHNSSKTFRYRARFGYGFTVGYFGRIVKETIPYDYLSVLSELERQIPGISTVFAGSVRTAIPSPSVQTASSIPFADMPYAISACHVLLANEQPESNWAGSVKPLEAMGCGIPIVLSKRGSRLDQLGRDYPLFYETASELRNHILRLYNDTDFYDDVRKYLLKRAPAFYTPSRVKELEPIIRDLANMPAGS